LVSGRSLTNFVVYTLRLVSSLAAVILCAVAARPAARVEAGSSRHVVLISLDGFPASALADPRMPVPTLQRLARDGTVAKELLPVNPVVTWPNHTTMVTGVRPAVHGVMWNGLLLRDGEGPLRVEPWRDKTELVRAPTVYDAAHAGGLTTAEVDWVAIFKARTITWAFPEVPSVSGSVEQEMIAAGLLSANDVTTFHEHTSGAWRDQRWTDAAVHIIERHKPNLMLFHLLALDGINHEYGPGTPASQTAMAFLDAQVARVLTALDRAGIRAQTTVMIVSDHGFRVAARSIHPNVTLRELGLITGNAGDLRAEAWSLSWGGAAGIYVRDRTRRDEVLARIAGPLRAMEGVERAIGSQDLASVNFPEPSALDQAPDLVLTAAKGYDFEEEDTGPPITPARADHLGHHGAIESDPDMAAIFIASGHDVAPGQSLDVVRNLDIAPTIAEWLGVTLPGVEGQSLAGQLANRGAEAPPPKALIGVTGEARQ
jgi:predicted AlkP superfamily pyrophosphatase or phosphodiesterase